MPALREDTLCSRLPAHRLHFGHLLDSFVCSVVCLNQFGAQCGTQGRAKLSSKTPRKHSKAAAILPKRSKMAPGATEPAKETHRAPEIPPRTENGQEI